MSDDLIPAKTLAQSEQVRRNQMQAIKMHLAEITRLTAELAERDAEIERLRTALAERDAEIERLRGEADRYDRLTQCYRLEQVVLENGDLRKQLAAERQRARMPEDLVERLRHEYQIFATTPLGDFLDDLLAALEPRK